VRGLDYYMRTTFEITAPGLGSQDAVCGGGRYDGLVELLGGPPTKGIGFAIGEDRLILSLQESVQAPAAQGRDVYIAGWVKMVAPRPSVPQENSAKPDSASNCRPSSKIWQGPWPGGQTRRKICAHSRR